MRILDVHGVTVDHKPTELSGDGVATLIVGEVLRAALPFLREQWEHERITADAYRLIDGETREQAMDRVAREVGITALIDRDQRRGEALRRIANGCPNPDRVANAALGTDDP